MEREAVKRPPALGDYVDQEETPHQRRQRALSDRLRGGPHEQQLSAPARLRNTRSGEILHSSLLEPLSPYKSLQPLRPQWPSTYRRFHLNHGIRVVDQDTCVVHTQDTLTRTKHGLLRSSSGVVTYSFSHRTKVELDVFELARILHDGLPGSGHTWKPQQLERIFRERTGRRGSWAHYEVPFKEFLALFPRTFERFGLDNQFVRLRFKQNPHVLDVSEEALVHLARAREHGIVEPRPHTVGCGSVKAKAAELHELRMHRFKAVFRPKDSGGGGRGEEEGRDGASPALGASTLGAPMLGAAAQASIVIGGNSG